MVTDILDVVTNDTKITSDINFDEFTEDMEITAAPVEVEEEVIEEETPSSVSRRCLRSRAVT